MAEIPISVVKIPAFVASLKRDRTPFIDTNKPISMSAVGINSPIPQTLPVTKTCVTYGANEAAINIAINIKSLK